MEIPFAILTALTLVSALAAMSLRNLVHCALCLALTLAGLAALYLQLGAQFAGFAQILVYVGAVAILVVFAILLTNRGDQAAATRAPARSWVSGAGIAVAVFAVLARVILTSSLATGHPMVDRGSPTVKDLGMQLMTQYVLPLEVIGLLLTAATLGAVIIALPEKKTPAAAAPNH